MQAHISGQIPGQLPRSDTHLTALSQQNPRLQAYAAHRNDMLRTIYEFFIQRQCDIPSKNMVDIVRGLEEELFKSAGSMEDYMNVETLESRLFNLISNLPPNNHNRQSPHLVNSSAIMGAKMIPTPGMMHSQNSNFIASSSDTSTNSNSSINTAHSFNINGGSSFSSPDGAMPNEYQHSSNFCSGKNTMSSLGMQKINNRMIPTPGLNNKNSNQSYMNLKVPNHSRAMPRMVSLEQTQNQHVNNLNNCILPNLGSQSRSGRSGIQQNSYRLSNGPPSDGLGMLGNSMKAVSEPSLPEDCLTPMLYGVGEFGMGFSDPSVSANCFVPVSSSGSMMNIQNSNSASLHDTSKSCSQLTANQQTLQYPRPVPYIAPSHHRYQNLQQQNPRQFQHSQQFVENNLQQNKQHLLKNNTSNHSQSASEICNQNDGLNRKISEQFLFSGHQNQFHPNSIDEQNSYSPHPRCSQQMQQVSHLQQLTETQRDFPCFPFGSQPESIKEGQWISQSSDASAINQAVAPCDTIENQSTNSSSGRTELIDREKQFRNQQRWLLFIRHARRCEAPQGECPEIYCVFVQKLWRHMLNCNLAHCPQPRCHPTRILLGHYKSCTEPDCPVCVPVRNFMQAQYKRRIDCELSDKSYNTAEKDTGLSSISSVVNTQPAKRTKTDHNSQSLSLENESSAVSVLTASEPEVHHDDNQHGDVPKQMKYGVSRVEVQVLEGSGHRSPMISETKKDNLDDFCSEKLNVVPTLSVELINAVKRENVEHEIIMDRSKQESLSAPPAELGRTKFEKPKIKGVSLTELFTPEQIREHIIGLRQWVGQGKAKAEKNQAMEHLMSDNCCQLCAVEKLAFDPPPIYCTPCGARIKRNALYHTMVTGVARHYLCNPCYTESRGDTITIDGSDFSKTKLDKKKNDEETEEGWVQCDKCEAWQHQICALFNGRRNDGGQAEYTCPNCYISELERGERKPLPESSVLGAKDLPTTLLSDHIEDRLFRRLKQERQQRASVQGKSYDEVPGAKTLVVRVVSSVDKKLDVKQRFHEIFGKDNYPIEFPYKSKVVLLFQEIEGVEVCLFGMYLQEFGSECQYPNQRRVYLSYLDSVKYFRPDIKAVTGEALRTFVYHEILIGYLEYCKLRGFTTCYIWACPPLKGEDYILYCHPEIQKTPKSDKLRDWYLSMLRKASKEDIVVDLTNLYDHFFVSAGECKAKLSAARLPYFDGDYWPGAAEDMLYQLSQEEDARKHNKGAIKKTITKRALKSSSYLDSFGNPSKDLLLMHKLGETISPMKEDFIMVHLQHACSHCCHLMVSGNRWICKQCKNFQLCDKCYDGERKLGDRERHPIHQCDKHTLCPVQINVASDTKDKDEILESEFFDTRQAFLGLCQGNHYQYDTLRRAKHSSMMLLYHLHNPTAPAFVTACIKCCLDIESGQGWRCEICADYEVCDACYQKDGGVDHPHKLTVHPSTSECDYPNKGVRQSWDLQRRKLLELLAHAAACHSTLCPYPNCRKLKGLFGHGNQCKTRMVGGCVLCKKMWFLIHLHVRACNESQCSVPRCSDMKKHMKRLQQQSEWRRRAAVNEMMRNRAAEIAGNRSTQ